MPNKRLTMRNIKEILRLRFNEGLSQDKIAQSCGIGQSTVSDLLIRVKAAGYEWPLPEEVNDKILEKTLYPANQAKKDRPKPDLQNINKELKRKGVTLLLLWQEYRLNYPDNGYSYQQFCNLYRSFVKNLDPVMRQKHLGGEKLFVDFSGQGMELTNPETGEVKELQVFVAALGASQYIFADICDSQNLHSWISVHIDAFEFFEGVAEVTVPDNLKSGVTKPSYYEPDINPTYLELAKHYGTVIIPARVRKPKDKSKVENGVQQVQRWILAPLRKHTFFSKQEIRQEIRKRLEWLNNRPLSNSDETRRTLYEKIDKPFLKPLPIKRYEIAEWKTDVGVNIDYHFAFDKHF